MCKGFAALSSTCLERAKEMKVHLGQFLHKPKAVADCHRVSPEKHGKVTVTTRPGPEGTSKGGIGFEKLLATKRGVSAFRAFLRSEFSEENINFWLACEDYRDTKTVPKLTLKAQKIYEEFIKVQAPKEVNLDSLTREIVTKNLFDPTGSCFQVAQERIYSLMEKDSFPRFLKSDFFLPMLKTVEHGIKGRRWGREPEGGMCG
ncbi:regulator of G-protein signaling 5-like [Pristis pectinata]|uniref:regulator of G-protein signaling 5-like n=1 Tax=Pristis pectinata TaxID=685728 RepID=UPI00223E1B75|nr:regulator of G-protein signaling 5-like [Pristis pectinata]